MELNDAEKVYRLLSTNQITPPKFSFDLIFSFLTFMITLEILFFLLYHELYYNVRYSNKLTTLQGSLKCFVQYVQI